jgi:MFS family permease
MVCVWPGDPAGKQPAMKLPRDILILFSTRIVRLFAYGSLSVMLALYLAAVGLTEPQIGLLLTLTLVGDTAVSLWLTTRADRFGRRRTLMIGAVLMVAAGLVFAVTHDFWLLLLAATVGVISPSGNEVGPFLSIEQAALSHIVSDRNRTKTFAWYTLAGSLATAGGSLAGGLLIGALELARVTPIDSYRTGVAGYALMGVALLLLFTRLSSATEVDHPNSPLPKPGETPHNSPRPLEQEQGVKAHNSPLPLAKEGQGVRAHNSPLPLGEGQGVRVAAYLGLARSHRVVLRLSALFAIDAFGGGFVIQSLTAYWFYLRFGVSPSMLGGIFFGANLLAGLSALAAVRLAARFGLINTMVFTHLPSNILLILVPLMPNLPLAIAVLFLRFSISQMDVPTRQSYVMAVVPPEERSAAAGVTGVARTIGASIAPMLAGVFLAHAATFDLLFYMAGGLKIVYDLLLYRSFITVRPPEEKK